MHYIKQGQQVSHKTVELHNAAGLKIIIIMSFLR